MVIPTGSPGISNTNDLAKSETVGFLNEIKCEEFAFVSPFKPNRDACREGLDPINGLAAPTAIGNGQNGKKSTPSDASFYHKVIPAATRAGLWYAENRENCPRPIVPTLRSRFGLSALDAIQAIRVANGVQR